MNNKSKKQQGGATLIEVLVSMVIIMVGVLGAIGLKVVSARAVADSNLRSTAAMYAQDILERARANPARATSGGYNLAAGAQPPSAPVNIAETDLVEWSTRLSTNLPSGKGTVNVVGSAVTVTVQWLERAPQNSTGQLVTFSFTSQL